MPLAFLTWLFNLEWPSSLGECRAESWGTAGTFCAPTKWFTQEAWGKLLHLSVSAHLYSKCCSTYFPCKILWISWAITGEKKTNQTNHQENLWCKWWENCKKLQNISGWTRCSSVFINTCCTDFSRLGLHFHSLNEWQVYLSGLLKQQIKKFEPYNSCKSSLDWPCQRLQVIAAFLFFLVSPEKQVTL